MKNFLCIFFMFTWIGGMAQQYSQLYSNLNYVGDGQGYHNLDIYLPKTVKDNYPVVMYIYGSAWYSNNSKGTDMNTIGAALLDAGFAVVVPNHRSSSDAKFPAQIHDIKAAIRFLRGKAADYKLDTTFIGISGSSSGGHLASLAGTGNGVKQYTVGSATIDVEGNLGNYTSFSSKVHAVCDWFGPIDFSRMENCRTYKDGNSPEAHILGFAPASNPDKTALLSPMTYIDPTDPPFLIFHGSQDNVVPDCQSRFFHEALTGAGVESEYLLVQGGQHGPGVNNVQANLGKMVDFFLDVSVPVITSFKDMNTAGGTFVLSENSSLDLSGLENRLVKYRVLDMAGRVMSEEKAGEGRIYPGGLANGLYLLQLFLSDGDTRLQRVAVWR